MNMTAKFTGVDSVERDVLIWLATRNISDSSNLALIPINNNTGKYNEDIRRDFPIYQREFEMVIKSRADAALLKTFIMERYGRLEPFWLPTFQNDFEMVFDQTGGYLYMRSIDYRDNYCDGSGEPDGSKRTMAFVNIPEEDFEFITVNVVLNTGVNDPDADPIQDNYIERLQGDNLVNGDKDHWTTICFMDMVRMTIDTVNMIWHQTVDELVTAKIKVRVIDPEKV